MLLSVFSIIVIKPELYSVLLVLAFFVHILLRLKPILSSFFSIRTAYVAVHKEAPEGKTHRTTPTGRTHSLTCVALWFLSFVLCLGAQPSGLYAAHLSSAWRILPRAAPRSTWPVFPSAAPRSAWCVLPRAAPRSAWRVFPSAAPGSACRVLPKAAPCSTWRVLPRAASGSTWRVFPSAALSSFWRTSPVAVCFSAQPVGERLHRSRLTIPLSFSSLRLNMPPTPSQRVYNNARALLEKAAKELADIQQRLSLLPRDDNDVDAVASRAALAELEDQVTSRVEKLTEDVLRAKKTLGALAELETRLRLGFPQPSVPLLGPSMNSQPSWTSWRLSYDPTQCRKITTGEPWAMSSLAVTLCCAGWVTRSNLLLGSIPGLQTGRRFVNKSKPNSPPASPSGTIGTSYLR